MHLVVAINKRMPTGIMCISQLYYTTSIDVLATSDFDKLKSNIYSNNDK